MEHFHVNGLGMMEENEATSCEAFTFHVLFFPFPMLHCAHAPPLYAISELRNINYPSYLINILGILYDLVLL